MTKIKKPSILTPKTLLSGIAGISLIVGMSLAPVSFVYASGNDGSGTNVADSGSEAGETANPAREAAENSMSNTGLNMESSAREIGDAARNAANGVHKEAESKMAEHAKEASDQGKENSNHQSDHADGQQNMDKNAAPMVLADFISSMRKGNLVVASDAANSNLELRYANGWKEEIDHGRYVLVDPNGNKIISRPVTDADISRMRSALK